MASYAALPIQDEQTQDAIEAFKEGRQIQAIEALTMRATDGVLLAQYNLGVISLLSKDSTSKASAKFWFREAAEAGDVESQFNLGMLLFSEAKSGANKFSKLENSVRWLSRAAEAGLPRAQYNLGRIALTNQGLSVSNEQGYALIESAAAAGDQRAKIVLEALQSQQTENLPGLYGNLAEFRTNSNNQSVVVSEDNTELFAYPASRQTPLMLLGKNTPVEILKTKDGWVSIRLPEGLPGWIKSDEVILRETSAVVAGLEGSIYVEPDQNRDVLRIGVVSKGEELAILDQQDGWVKVISPRRFPAWLRERQLEVARVADTSQTESQQSDSEVKISESQNTNTQQTSAETTSKVSDNESNTQLETSNQVVKLKKLRPSSNQSSIARLTRNALVFRDPGAGSKPIGVAEKGSQVEILENNGDFQRVKLEDNATAWVFATLVDVQDRKGTIKGDDVRVRSQPNTSDNARIIAKFNKGQVLEILGKTEKWYKIRLPEARSGWVVASLIESN